MIIPEETSTLTLTGPRDIRSAMNSMEHWQEVYSKKSPDQVSWYRPHLEQSLDFIRSGVFESDARIVDVGGGASTLVDDLLDEGYRNVAVIDIADRALAAAKTRLGERAALVDWLVGDVTTELLPRRSIDFWHDRAVFHFLTEVDARAAYLAQVHRAMKPGGHILVATFGLDGPETCSGLPVARYDSESIHAVFGEMYEKVGAAAEQHETPWGTAQSFVYCFCRRLT